jgi:hypothetical protein
MVHRSADCRRRCGAAVEKLAHSASFHSWKNNALSKRGIKHLGNQIAATLSTMASRAA